MDKQEERKPQIDKFREAARELKTDDSEENFDRSLKIIANSLTKEPSGPKTPTAKPRHTATPSGRSKRRNGD